MKLTVNQKINGLIGYTFVVTALLVFVLLTSFGKNEKTENFSEINVERINIVEKNGDLKMVISNKERQHNGIVDGVKLKPREREAGIIFFNGIGDECGGLVYGANDKEAGLVFSVDQFRDDQIMQLQYLEEKAKTNEKLRSYGLKLWDRRDDIMHRKIMATLDSLKEIPGDAYSKEIDKLVKEGKLGTERMFVGKDFNDNVGLFIRDKKGNPRIKIYINKANETVLELIDKNGKQIKELK